MPRSVDSCRATGGWNTASSPRPKRRRLDTAPCSIPAVTGLVPGHQAMGITHPLEDVLGVQHHFTGLVSRAAGGVGGGNPNHPDHGQDVVVPFLDLHSAGTVLGGAGDPCTRSRTGHDRVGRSAVVGVVIVTGTCRQALPCLSLEGCKLVTMTALMTTPQSEQSAPATDGVVCVCRQKDGDGAWGQEAFRGVSSCLVHTRTGRRGQHLCAAAPRLVSYRLPPRAPGPHVRRRTLCQTVTLL